LTRILKTCN